MKDLQHTQTSPSLDASYQHERTRFIILKLLLIALMTVGAGLLVNLCLRFDIIYGDHLIGEVSMTECVQQILLGITIVAFYRVKLFRPELRHGAILIAGFFMVLFIRELDFLFDAITHGFWIYPALLVTFAAIVYACSGKKQAWYSLGSICHAPNMRLLVASLMVLLVFSRLMGEASFWKAIMQDGYVRVVKNAIEEGIELLCYAMIAISAVSCELWLTKKHRNHTTHHQEEIAQTS
ncbi:hypothetical protein VA7868_03046 [Vibrio aerogenes CECT 7868]|uniref:Uncharacterized protein n=1 Tax=Vibrio aerogenes CECT 7868 TaxID=1216006 RepID=A0A1M5ZPX3_9VIBR|nr:hypothetical protein [Vibrio aerogenes]SHI26327.1 hypothetical protein VA7868_03046 [Vibrio aerogenes CECT 7868]